MPKEKSQVKQRQDIKLNVPRRYSVIIHNDDFTTMDFVVMILKQVFFKDDADAEQLMLRVHQFNQAVVGIYSYDIATSKAHRATALARDNGFPLRLTVQPEEE